jgi:hypothetical protein
MGIGFILAFFVIVGIGVSMVFAIIAIARVSLNKPPGPERSSAQIKAGCFPFILLGYLGISFFMYSIFCETVRGVDPGIGDSWRVPLAGEYSMVMIDLPTEASIHKSRSSESYLYTITKINVVDDLIAGTTDKPSGYFLIDTKSGDEHIDLTQTDFRTIIAQKGLRNPELISPNALYSRLRWTFADAMAVVVILGVPVVIFALWRRNSQPMTQPLPDLL